MNSLDKKFARLLVESLHCYALAIFMCPKCMVLSTEVAEYMEVTLTFPCSMGDGPECSGDTQRQNVLDSRGHLEIVVMQLSNIAHKQSGMLFPSIASTEVSGHP
jgi:hypothetical protein